LEGQNGGPAAAYREQKVEIALGPNGAFENGNIGTLTRRTPTDRVVNAVPRRHGNPKPPWEPKTPRVVELLRKAIEWRALLESGEVANQAAIARREGITRARMTQVLGLQQHTVAASAGAETVTVLAEAGIEEGTAEDVEGGVTSYQSKLCRVGILLRERT